MCSAIAPIMENVGDAALLASPLDYDGLTAHALSILEDNGVARRLRYDGIARAALFTWERAARETFGVYETVLAEQGS